MEQLEMILFWIACFGYVAVFVTQLFAFANKKSRIMKYIQYLLFASFGFHSAVLILHWIISGNPPTTNRFEIDLSGAWFIMLLYLFLLKTKKVEQAIALIIVPITFLLMGYAYTEGVNFLPVRPAFMSPWIVVHVIFAWFAFSCYAIASGMAIFYLIKSKRPQSEALKRLPELEALDEKSYRFVALGFINHAIMLVAGALWAKQLWGYYWSWDPLDTWNLIAFLSYSFVLHARTFLKWRGEKMAYLVLLALLIMSITYWGVGLFVNTPHPIT